MRHRDERGTRSAERSDKLRALNVPQRVEVERDAKGEPRAVGKSVVEVILESWRIDDEWWRKQIARVYFEIVLTGGKRVVLFNDMTTGEWWMQMP